MRNGDALIDTMTQDVRFGIRQVRRTPMVSLFIIATLATAALLFAIGALGSLLPALRASRIEPTEALRSQ